MPITRYRAHDDDCNPIDNLEKLPRPVVQMLRDAGLTDDEIRTRDWELHDTDVLSEGMVEIGQLLATARQRLALEDGAGAGYEVVAFDHASSDDDLTDDDLQAICALEEQGQRGVWHEGLTAQNILSERDLKLLRARFTDDEIRAIPVDWRKTARGGLDALNAALAEARRWLEAADRRDH
jgi:hypothetical protein